MAERTADGQGFDEESNNKEGKGRRGAMDGSDMTREVMSKWEARVKTERTATENWSSCQINVQVMTPEGVVGVAPASTVARDLLGRVLSVR